MAAKKYTYAIGRRKSSSARVRLFKGKGESTVNGKKLQDYFPGKINKEAINRPFVETETEGKFFFTAKIVGGGKIGQLDALVHGISRALNTLKPEKYRKVLKKVRLLTRDSRSRLRRMVGMGGKSRRQRQSPKR
ncbi:30S ribosomal protein S9 [Candidatus Microgenomates bacterium]|nr:30S ribosomal protein S9 [Candidatus Microgenomates bacterium]